MVPWTLLLPQHSSDANVDARNGNAMTVKVSDASLVHQVVVNTLTAAVRRPHEPLALAMSALEHAQQRVDAEQLSNSTTQPSLKSQRHAADAAKSTAPAPSGGTGLTTAAQQSSSAGSAARTMFLFAFVRSAVRVFRGSTWDAQGLAPVNLLWQYVSGLVTLTCAGVAGQQASQASSGNQSDAVAAAVLHLLLDELRALNNDMVATCVDAGGNDADMHATGSTAGGAKLYVRVAGTLLALAGCLQQLAHLAEGALHSGCHVELSAAVGGKRKRHHKNDANGKSAATRLHVYVSAVDGSNSARNAQDGAAAPSSINLSSVPRTASKAAAPAAEKATRTARRTWQAVCAFGLNAPTELVSRAIQQLSGTSSFACLELALVAALTVPAAAAAVAGNIASSTEVWQSAQSELRTMPRNSLDFLLRLTAVQIFGAHDVSAASTSASQASVALALLLRSELQIHGSAYTGHALQLPGVTHTAAAIAHAGNLVQERSSAAHSLLQAAWQLHSVSLAVHTEGEARATAELLQICTMLESQIKDSQQLDSCPPGNALHNAALQLLQCCAHHASAPEMRRQSGDSEALQTAHQAAMIASQAALRQVPLHALAQTLCSVMQHQKQPAQLSGASVRLAILLLEASFASGTGRQACGGQHGSAGQCKDIRTGPALLLADEQVKQALTAVLHSALQAYAHRTDDRGAQGVAAPAAGLRRLLQLAFASDSGDLNALQLHFLLQLGSELVAAAFATEDVHLQVAAAHAARVAPQCALQVAQALLEKVSRKDGSPPHAADFLGKQAPFQAIVAVLTLSNAVSLPAPASQEGTVHAFTAACSNLAAALRPTVLKLLFRGHRGDSGAAAAEFERAVQLAWLCLQKQPLAVDKLQSFVSKCAPQSGFALASAAHIPEQQQQQQQQQQTVSEALHNSAALLQWAHSCGPAELQRFALAVHMLTSAADIPASIATGDSPKSACCSQRLTDVSADADSVCQGVCTLLKSAAATLASVAAACHSIENTAALALCTFVDGPLGDVIATLISRNAASGALRSIAVGAELYTRALCLHKGTTLSANAAKSARRLWASVMHGSAEQEGTAETFADASNGSDANAEGSGDEVVCPSTPPPPNAAADVSSDGTARKGSDTAGISKEFPSTSMDGAQMICRRGESSAVPSDTDSSASEQHASPASASSDDEMHDDEAATRAAANGASQHAPAAVKLRTAGNPAVASVALHTLQALLDNSDIQACLFCPLPCGCANVKASHSGTGGSITPPGSKATVSHGHQSADEPGNHTASHDEIRILAASADCAALPTAVASESWPLGSLIGLVDIAPLATVPASSSGHDEVAAGLRRELFDLLEV